MLTEETTSEMSLTSDKSTSEGEEIAKKKLDVLPGYPVISPPTTSPPSYVLLPRSKSETTTDIPRAKHETAH